MNKKTVTITNAQENDFSIIVELIRSLADYERKLDQVVFEEAQLKTCLFGKEKFAQVFIASVEDQPAGFALFFHNFSTFIGKPGIYLEDFFVKPQFRRHGVASRLMEALIAHGKAQDCFGIEFSVLTWNEDALAFYKQFGAQSKHEWDIYRILF